MKPLKKDAPTFLSKKNINAVFGNDILSGQWHAYNQLKSHVKNTLLLSIVNQNEFLERKVGASFDSHHFLMVSFLR